MTERIDHAEKAAAHWLDDPAFQDVRSWYIDGRRAHNPFASDAELVERFDSWWREVQAEHESELKAAKAEAWDRAESVFEEAHNSDMIEPWLHMPDNPYREGGRGNE